MSFAVAYSRALRGVDAPLITIEADISNGLPKFSIVGLPATAVQESKDRVRSALLNCNFEFPSKRITINLAPADLPKEGCRFDLPIAIGILAASRQIPTELLCNYEFAGELALSGELRPIHGILPFAIATANSDRGLIVPNENAEQANIANQCIVYPAIHLLDICAHLCKQKILQPLTKTNITTNTAKYPDISDVRAQSQAKRALTIAAAGQHSLLMVGPP